MALVCLIYTSRSKELFSPAQLAQLTRASAERNAFRDISGALLYCDGIFLQMLEGQDWVVREVFEKIARDPRHHDVQELYYAPIDRRSFGGWGMSLMHDEHTDAAEQRSLRKIFLRLKEVAGPRSMADSVQTLILQLKNAIERQSLSAGLRQAA